MFGQFWKCILGNTGEGIVERYRNALFSWSELPTVRRRDYPRSATERVHLTRKRGPLFR
jgi:hypothetical protein